MHKSDAIRNTEIFRLGNILNSKIKYLKGINLQHRIAREGDYRFAPLKSSVEIRDLSYSEGYSHHLFSRIKAAYLLGRVYRNARDESEKQRAEEELRQCRLGKFFKYIYRESR